MYKLYQYKAKKCNGKKRSVNSFYWFENSCGYSISISNLKKKSLYLRKTIFNISDTSYTNKN